MEREDRLRRMPGEDVPINDSRHCCWTFNVRRVLSATRLALDVTLAYGASTSSPAEAMRV